MTAGFAGAIEVERAWAEAYWTGAAGACARCPLGATVESKARGSMPSTPGWRERLERHWLRKSGRMRRNAPSLETARASGQDPFSDGRVQVEHGAAMPDQAIAIGPDGIVEGPLGIQVFQGAGLPLLPAPERRVPHFLGRGDDHLLGPQHVLQAQIELADGIEDVVIDVAFRALSLQLRLKDVDLGAADVALVPVEKGHGRRHADRPRSRALNAQVRVVLVGVGLPEQVNVGVTVGLAELHVGMSTLHGQPH